MKDFGYLEKKMVKETQFIKMKLIMKGNLKTVENKDMELTDEMMGLFLRKFLKKSHTWIWYLYLS